jgi:hypothetical protein
LSPILFNLYINGIVDDLEKAKTDPVIVGDVQVNFLPYADALISLGLHPVSKKSTNYLIHLKNFVVLPVYLTTV